MVSLLLAIIYIAFISLGLPDSLLGSSWPIMQVQLGVPISYAGIITMIIYTALALASTALINLISSSVILPIILLALGALLFVRALLKKKLAGKIFGIVFAVLGVLGLVTYLDLLGGIEIPILQLGIPAVLSLYFDLFSGFVQAFVFSLLSMVYIAGALPEPAGQE